MSPTKSHTPRLPEVSELEARLRVVNSELAHALLSEVVSVADVTSLGVVADLVGTALIRARREQAASANQRQGS